MTSPAWQGPIRPLSSAAASLWARRHPRSRILRPPPRPRQVAKLSDLSAINERCMDLQQSKRAAGGSKSRKAAGGGCGGNSAAGCGGAPSLAQLGAAGRQRAREGKGKGGCPYLQRVPGGGGGSSGAEGMDGFKSAVLAAPADVEELARMGRAQQARAGERGRGPRLAQRPPRRKALQAIMPVLRAPGVARPVPASAWSRRPFSLQAARARRRSTCVYANAGVPLLRLAAGRPGG